jgi:predicted acetyltransferase
VGFALIRGLTGERRAISGFWVAPAARRTGLGRALALQVIAAYEGPWEIAFQEDNVGAGHFWRRVATEAWGEAWVESAEPVPGRPDVPPDHWIRTRGCP